MQLTAILSALEGAHIVCFDNLNITDEPDAWAKLSKYEQTFDEFLAELKLLNPFLDGTKTW
jgi:hypothetical protein